MPDFFRFDSATLVPYEWAEAKFVVRGGLMGGHFPGAYSIQLSICSSLLLRAHTPEWKNAFLFILGINRARFYKELLPGDEVTVFTKIVKIREDKPVVTLATTLQKGDEVAVDMEIAIYLDPNHSR
jgi:acyl dehydratase